MNNIIRTNYQYNTSVIKKQDEKIKEGGGIPKPQQHNIGTLLAYQAIQKLE